MRGIIATGNFEPKELMAKIEASRTKDAHSRLPEISVDKPLRLGPAKARSARVTVIDLGVTAGIIAQLRQLGCAVTLVPYHVTADIITRTRPRGVIISGGPEQDAGLRETTKNIKALIGKVPLLGIATGCQVLARAMGAEVVRLRCGHHGVNYPVYSPGSYKGAITVQNHSWVVDIDSLKGIKQLKVTAYNLNDRTIEGFESRKLRCIGAQYNPVSPGFDEVNEVFIRFLKMATAR
jgi:carbamoyl-phosphate synthase small subunit